MKKILPAKRTLVYITTEQLNLQLYLEKIYLNALGLLLAILSFGTLKINTQIIVKEFAQTASGFSRYNRSNIKGNFMIIGKTSSLLSCQSPVFN